MERVYVQESSQTVCFDGQRVTSLWNILRSGSARIDGIGDYLSN
jgi:hypothetical protein